MAHIIDLQRLWGDHKEELAPAVDQMAMPAFLKPDQRIISVIVIAHEDEEKLFKSLQSIVTQLFIFEIVIVNRTQRSSIKSSLDKFIKLHPRCYSVAAPSTVGLAEAYNIGARYASAPFLLFLDGRYILPQYALLKLLATAIPKPFPSIIGVKKAEPHRISSVLNKLTSYYALVFAPKPFLPQCVLPGGGQYAFDVGPQCLFMTAKTWTFLKGMDEKCFDANFHRDLCLRTHLAGGNVYQMDNFDLVFQRTSTTSLARMIRHEWDVFWGWCYFYNKYVRRRANIFSALMCYSLFSLFAVLKVSYAIALRRF